MMNLAEIRKKAQRERDPGDSTDAAPDRGALPAGDVCPEPEDEYLQPDPDPMPEEEPAAFAEEAQGELLAEEPDPSPDEEPAPLPAAEPEPVTEDMPGPLPGKPSDRVVRGKPERTFDPVGLILAGRLSSGTAADFSAAVEQAAGAEGEDLGKYLRFRVADEEYGVSLMDIKEIVKARAVTEVPRMPRFVAGVLSLRGVIIPIFDLRLRLGFIPGDPTGLERIIIIKAEDGARGLLVDEVHQVVGLGRTDIGEAPPVLEGVDREFVKGIGRVGGKMLILLDLEKVLDEALR